MSSTSKSTFMAHEKCPATHIKRLRRSKVLFIAGSIICRGMGMHSEECVLEIKSDSNNRQILNAHPSTRT